MGGALPERLECERRRETMPHIRLVQDAFAAIEVAALVETRSGPAPGARRLAAEACTLARAKLRSSAPAPGWRRARKLSTRRSAALAGHGPQCGSRGGERCGAAAGGLNAVRRLLARLCV